MSSPRPEGNFLLAFASNKELPRCSHAPYYDYFLLHNSYALCTTDQLSNLGIGLVILIPLIPLCLRSVCLRCGRWMLILNWMLAQF